MSTEYFGLFKDSIPRVLFTDANLNTSCRRRGRRRRRAPGGWHRRRFLRGRASGDCNLALMHLNCELFVGYFKNEISLPHS